MMLPRRMARNLRHGRRRSEVRRPGDHCRTTTPPRCRPLTTMPGQALIPCRPLADHVDRRRQPTRQ